MESKKTCFKCNQEKTLNSFYKHSGMKDGHLNKCKDCAILDNLKFIERIRSTPEGVEKERARHRDKYKRLGYKEKQKIWDENKYWKLSQEYKNQKRNISRLIPKQKNQETHHWNYNLLKSVFVLNISLHRKFHRLLIFDNETLCFWYNGNLLDTKEKHRLAINEVILKLSVETEILEFEL